MDLNVRGGALVSSRRNIPRSQARYGTSLPEGEAGNVAFERFVAGGNEKTDELAEDEAMLDRGEMAQTRASTFQQRREEVYAALQHAARFHCLVGGVAGL